MSKDSKVMEVFDAVTAVALDPQPEPPGFGEMFDILDLIGAVAAPTIVVY